MNHASLDRKSLDRVLWNSVGSLFTQNLTHCKFLGMTLLGCNLPLIFFSLLFQHFELKIGFIYFLLCPLSGKLGMLKPSSRTINFHIKKSDLLFLSWNLSLRNTMIKKQDKSCLTNMKLTPWKILTFSFSFYIIFTKLFRLNHFKVNFSDYWKITFTKLCRVVAYLTLLSPGLVNSWGKLKLLYLYCCNV